MPNEVINVQPVPAPPSDRPKASGQIAGKAWPVAVGGFVYGVTQIVGMLAGKAGIKIDPTILQVVSGIAGGVSCVASGSPSLLLTVRILNLQMLLACHLITKASYTRMKKTVEEAFEKKIRS